MIPIPWLEWVNGAGVILPLEWPGAHVLEHSGLGMPPIKHWTTRSPYQHGVTHWGYSWQPRIVNLVLYSQGGTRQGKFNLRAQVIDSFNPAYGAGKLRLTLPDGNIMELHDCWYNGNYELSSADAMTTTQIGGVQIKVCDPFYKWVTAPLNAGETRDADGRSCVVDDTWTLTAQLTLPFVAPYLMGATTAENAITCTNSGGVAILPTLTVEGPIEDWVISNTTTGQQLTWDGYSIGTGEIVTINVKQGTVSSSWGVDVSSYLRGHTGSFQLDPGANAINVHASGGVVNATTTIGLCWYLEALGV